jgi:hypothetical protein
VQCYAALSKLFSDPENLAKTFEEWLELALLAERRLQREGLAVARIVIRPVPFAAWCKERNLIPDQRTRLTFSNEAARHHYSHTSGGIPPILVAVLVPRNRCAVAVTGLSQ